jgi:hypothetical protein
MTFAMINWKGLYLEPYSATWMGALGRVFTSGDA